MKGTQVRKILIVTGTRPNFVKVTQFKKRVVDFPSLEIEIVHTGQHYDDNMSAIFFRQFNLIPDHFLNIQAGSPASQIAEIIQGLESLVKKIDPNLIMVVGDVNSTLAASLVANKMNVPLAHLESGLRSLDRTMPEEINRIITDELTQFFFITEESGLQNLLQEGKRAEQLHLVGNTMIDTLVAFQDEIDQCKLLEELKMPEGDFVLMTIHRFATVDNPEKLEELLSLMEWLLLKQKIVFPIHPRTIENLKKYDLYNRFEMLQGLFLTEPLGYFDFQKLVSTCSLILTDSGGIQEESTFLQKPCLTLRPNTERPVTTETGSNTLIGEDWTLVPQMIDSILAGKYKKGVIPPMWDGHSTERILTILDEQL